MNRSSRLLRVVVAGVLLSQGGTATATTYDDETVTVSGSYWGGASTFVDYPDIDDYDIYDNYGDNYGDYDSGGGSSEGEQVDQAACDAIAAEAPEGCDIANPPIFTANGCGGGMFAPLVPDYLIVNGTVVTRLGAIFSAACDSHDQCYAEYPSDKDACDARLGADMIERARRRMTTFQWSYYERHVRFQAALYNTALQTQPGLTFANYFFHSAQGDGKCRYVANKSKEAGCTD